MDLTFDEALKWVVVIATANVLSEGVLFLIRRRGTLLWVPTLVFLLGSGDACQRDDSRQPVAQEVEKSVTWFVIDTGQTGIDKTACSFMKVNDMPCLYCEQRVHGGNAPAITCDWRFYAPELVR